MGDPGVVGDEAEVGQVGAVFEGGDEGFGYAAESEAWEVA